MSTPTRPIKSASVSIGRTPGACQTTHPTIGSTCSQDLDVGWVITAGCQDSHDAQHPFAAGCQTTHDDHVQCAAGCHPTIDIQQRPAAGAFLLVQSRVVRCPEAEPWTRAQLPHLAKYPAKSTEPAAGWGASTRPVMFGTNVHGGPTGRAPTSTRSDECQ